MKSFDTLWAKGLRNGEESGETLETHTREVLNRIVELKQRYPEFSRFEGAGNIWDWLGIAAAIHDVGKIDGRFQDYLRGKAAHYGHRHEILSLGWVRLFAEDRYRPDLAWIAAIVASHHKDYYEIAESYPTGSVRNPDSGAVLRFLNGMNPAYLQRCEAFVTDCSTRLLCDSDLISAAWRQPVCRSSLTAGQIAEECSNGIRSWGFLIERMRTNLPDRILGILVRGLMMLADHAGSAHKEFGRRSALRDMGEMRRRLAPPAGHTFHPHQVEASETTGHALLVAPTGSGKTEAALLWASRQLATEDGHPPLFYVLPFKASLNAMRERIVKVLREETDGDSGKDQDRVVLQHSSAVQVLYHELMNRDSPGVRSTAEETAKRVRDLGQLHTAPVRVLSPYQLLRAAYGLKGYEAILTDAAGGLFVFDEIHAYEIGGLAQILGFTRYLVEQFGARVFVMTATMPEHVRGLVNAILNQPPQIRAADATYAAFRRHRLRLVEGGLLDGATVDEIARRALAGESVLAVATTVARTQELRGALSKRLPGTTVELLHSRFTGEDRTEKERMLRKKISTAKVREAGTGAREPVLLVATQVVEVSLDVDFDVLFTDAAPIEALVQRFGRVNRGRRGGTRDVMVCTRVEDATSVYDESLVKAGIDQLRGAIGTAAEGIEIDERNVQAWLDAVYSGDALKAFKQALREATADFAKVLDGLIPFGMSEVLEDQFYKMFDGAEVLPRSLFERYRTLSAESPLKASMLLVPVSQRQLQVMWGRGVVAKPTEYGLSPKGPLVVDVPYDNDTGLQVQPNPGDDRR